jgi:hypothetical protein
LLFDIAAETLRTIAADPKHLGARIGTTLCGASILLRARDDQDGRSVVAAGRACV